MTFDEFSALAAQGYNRIALNRSLNADLDTPLSAYLKLAGSANSFLLESVVGGERFGRYSFIGLPARTRIEARDTTVRVLSAKTAHAPLLEQFCVEEDPLAFVERYLAEFRAAPVPGLPRFAGGLAGYFGYDTIRYIEPRLNRPQAKARPDPMGVPDILLLLTEELAGIAVTGAGTGIARGATVRVGQAYEQIGLRFWRCLVVLEIVRTHRLLQASVAGPAFIEITHDVHAGSLVLRRTSDR